METQALNQQVDTPAADWDPRSVNLHHAGVDAASHSATDMMSYLCHACWGDGEHWKILSGECQPNLCFYH